MIEHMRGETKNGCGRALPTNQRKEVLEKEMVRTRNSIKWSMPILEGFIEQHGEKKINVIVYSIATAINYLYGYV